MKILRLRTVEVLCNRYEGTLQRPDVTVNVTDRRRWHVSGVIVAAFLRGQSDWTCAAGANVGGPPGAVFRNDLTLKRLPICLLAC